ncbi:MAG: TIGR00304 family membrane protein [Candidatus Bathyarchaeia archaeon]
MEKEDSVEESGAFRKFLMLFIVGFLMIFVGVIISMVTAAFYGEGTASFGGIIFIGPIPIVFGAGPEALLMVIISVILAVLSIIIFLLLRRELKRATVAAN